MIKHDDVSDAIACANNSRPMKTSLGKQAAQWLSEQVGDVGFTEAGRRFGISRPAVSYAWQASGLGQTPREKLKIATDGEDPIAVVAAQYARRIAYMREYNARTSEYHRLYNKQWYQDHKEHAKEAARAYRLDHPEQTREATQIREP